MVQLQARIAPGKIRVSVDAARGAHALGEFLQGDLLTERQRLVGRALGALVRRRGLAGASGARVQGEKASMIAESFGVFSMLTAKQYMCQISISARRA
jgi:hypothetical protein